MDRHYKWINRQITNAAESGDVTWLFDVILEHVSEMNLINCSTALHRIAKLALGSSVQERGRLVEHEAIRRLRRQLAGRVSEMAGDDHCRDGRGGELQSEMRCLSIICWSCATMRIREESFFQHVAAISGERLSEMKPFELSNMLWAFAKLSFGHASIFEGLAPYLLCRRPGQISPQCLSTIVWAFGTAKVHHVALFTSVALELSQHASSMGPQGIANTAWAFARVRRQELHLFRLLAEATVQESALWNFKSQELSNIVWAFATVGLTHPPLFESILEVAVQRRAELPPQNIANMLWAYAKLGVPSRWRLFPPLLEVTEQNLEAYKPQEVSAILWAVAREVGCSPSCRRFFLAVPRHFEGRLQEFTSQGLACMVEAYTLAEVDGLSFFDGILRESMNQLDSFQPPSLCTLFRGVAIKARRELAGKDSAQTPDHVRTISDHIAARLPEMQRHNIVHLAQSLDLLPAHAQVTSAAKLWESSTLLAVQHLQGELCEPMGPTLLPDPQHGSGPESNDVPSPPKGRHTSGLGLGGQRQLQRRGLQPGPQSLQPQPPPCAEVPWPVPLNGKRPTRDALDVSAALAAHRGRRDADEVPADLLPRSCPAPNKHGIIGPAQALQASQGRAATVWDLHSFWSLGSPADELASPYYSEHADQ
ncbi:unnamed protein product [Prorocentrum cordatum]|uniref:RNA-editing substrate-binding complex 6 protein domain-containing protein n=1 Tax=Prorocentrum cordatum TaxID=2364126 RepID=A0ABN9S656_9DINO|nr:unnamed protein product [Polarella glacialis]